MKTVCPNCGSPEAVFREIPDASWLRARQDDPVGGTDCSACGYDATDFKGGRVKVDNPGKAPSLQPERARP
jgi:hypothetical protein